MNDELAQRKDGFEGKVVIVTGGAGVLCSTICRSLAKENAKVVILDINETPTQNLTHELKQAGCEVMGLQCDVLDKQSLTSTAEKIVQAFGRVDGLINGAGGNNPGATTKSDLSFFDLPREAIERVVDLNLIGTIQACQVFGRWMAEQKKGVIINISSMNAFRPLTRVAAYSAAKAAISNFTQWLAVHMAKEYSPEIRVNAIAPGFFLTDQNRYLIIDENSGNYSERGRTIIEHTPMGRFGTPDDLTGTIAWLLSSASAFVTGIVVPIDGGFSAFSGV
jgi:NAD(P)-dependent dehydrogenase (short-subunit alcohol dehydrogenase family)